MNTIERIIALVEEQKAIEEKYHGRTELFRRDASNDRDRAEAMLRHTKIDNEIRELAIRDIKALQAELKEIEDYLKRRKKLLHFITGVPKEVLAAESRQKEIEAKINELEIYKRYR